MSMAPPSVDQSQRIRDNQRRSRARRAQYLKSLEEKVEHSNTANIVATTEIQIAARTVYRQKSTLQSWLARALNVPPQSVAEWLRMEPDLAERRFAESLAQARMESTPAELYETTSIGTKSTNAETELDIPPMTYKDDQQDGLLTRYDRTKFDSHRVLAGGDYQHMVCNNGDVQGNEPVVRKHDRSLGENMPRTHGNHCFATESTMNTHASQATFVPEQVEDLATNAQDPHEQLCSDVNNQASRKFCSMLTLLANAAEIVRQPRDAGMISCQESFNMLEPVLSEQVTVEHVIGSLSGNVRFTDQGVSVHLPAVRNLLETIELQECRKYTVSGECC